MDNDLSLKDAEFKQMAIQLALRGDRKLSVVARELNIPYARLRGWVRKHRLKDANLKASPDYRKLEQENKRLKEENEILKGGSVLRERKPAVKYAFIRKCSEDHRVVDLLRVLNVSPRGYYAWLARQDSPNKNARHVRREQLARAIKSIHAKSRKTYGAPRVLSELRGFGERTSKKTVARIMREERLVGRAPRKRKPVTESTTHRNIHPNYLARNFQVGAANAVWVGDITYIDTKHEPLYLATVIDLYSRKIVGWSMAAHLGAELVVDAFNMAVNRRGCMPQMFHSDRGSQYTSEAFAKATKGTLLSMSRKANCLDNAVAESFFSTLKIELVYRCHFQSFNDARTLIFDYVECFYNTVRKHSKLFYLTPTEYENLTDTA